MKRLHAYYSAKAAESCEIAIYCLREGWKEVTMVCDSKEWGDANYKWDDKVYLGLVCHYVREGRLPVSSEGRFPVSS